MKRILIIGCGGSGKSTLSKILSAKLSLPLIHLDKYYWKAGWVESQKSEWEDQVGQLIQKDQWIMDGNYGGTMDMRIERADTIIFLKLPTLVCFWRVFLRTIKYWQVSRPDMPEACPERFDLKFLHYILFYNSTRTPQILKKLKRVKTDKQILVFNTQKEVDAWLKSNQINQ